MKMIYSVFNILGYFIIVKNKMWDMLFSYDTPMIQYNKSSSELTYNYKNTEYSLLIKTRFKKPDMIEQVLNGDGIDITGLFRKRMGPSGDFHKIPYTVRDFNTSKISIEFLTQDIIEFKGNDIIKF